MKRLTPEQEKEVLEQEVKRLTNLIKIIKDLASVDYRKGRMHQGEVTTGELCYVLGQILAVTSDV